MTSDSGLKARISIHSWEVWRGSRTVTGGLKKKGFNTTWFHSQVCLLFPMQYSLQHMNGELSPLVNAWKHIYHVLNWSICHLRTPLKISESHNYRNTKCHHYCSYTVYMQIHAVPWSLNSWEMKWSSFFPLSWFFSFSMLWNKALHKTGTSLEQSIVITIKSSLVNQKLWEHFHIQC